MQGLGLFTLEELHYSPRGVLLTRGPGSYKIPAFGDIPTHLTVSLLRDAPNEKAVFASKVTLPTARRAVQKKMKILSTDFYFCTTSRLWASLLCFWPRRFSTPSRTPLAPHGPSRASAGLSGSTAPPPLRGSATPAVTSSPNWYESLTAMF